MQANCWLCLDLSLTCGWMEGFELGQKSVADDQDLTYGSTPLSPANCYVLARGMRTKARPAIPMNITNASLLVGMV